MNLKLLLSFTTLHVAAAVLRLLPCLPSTELCAPMRYNDHCQINSNGYFILPSVSCEFLLKINTFFITVLNNTLFSFNWYLLLFVFGLDLQYIQFSHEQSGDSLSRMYQIFASMMKNCNYNYLMKNCNCTSTVTVQSSQLFVFSTGSINKQVGIIPLCRM